MSTTALSHSPDTTPLGWDVQLHHTMRTLDSRFTLDVQWRSDAQRVVVLGPSGSGKTLMLRLLAGVLSAQKGRIVLQGRVLLDTAQRLDRPARERALGCVFQDYALFPHLTVRQNIAFAAQAGQDGEIDTWLERLDLRAVAGLLPHQVSGGQRQRTALARALMSRPRALLLDEPFAALDAALARRLRSELLELQKGLGLPMLLITHDEEDMRAFAQDTIELQGGRLRAVDGEATR